MAFPPTIDQSQLGDLLKNVYSSWEIQQLVNLAYPLLNEIAPKGDASLGGKGFFFPVRTESNEGHAYISEAQDFASVGKSSLVKVAEVDPTVQVGVIETTGLARALSQGSAAAFASAFAENVQQCLEAMSAYNEGVLFRDGTGQLATFVTEPDGALTTFTMSDVQYFREGMYIDVVDTDLTTHHNSALRVIAVDWANKTITTSAVVAAAAAAGDFAYLAESQEAAVAATSKEPVGLAGSVLNSGTYLGLDRAAAGNENWKALVQTESGFLDEEILLRARTRIAQESGIALGGFSRFAGVCHPQQCDVLFKLGIPRVRYAGGEAFDLGNSSNVTFGGITFKTSHQCPDGLLYLGDWAYHQTLYAPGGELHIDSEYNGASMKWVSSKDVGLVFAKAYRALALKRPNVFIKISGLSSPTR